MTKNMGEENMGFYVGVKLTKEMINVLFSISKKNGM